MYFTILYELFAMNIHIIVVPFKAPQWKEVHVLAAHTATPPGESGKSAAHDFGRLTFAIADYVRFAPSFLQFWLRRPSPLSSWVMRDTPSTAEREASGLNYYTLFFHIHRMTGRLTTPASEKYKPVLAYIRFRCLIHGLHSSWFLLGSLWISMNIEYFDFMPG